jgi:very-short-patch-repair endonuclease
MQKLTKEILQKRSNVIHHNQYEIIGKHVNNNTRIEMKHRSCGSIFYQQPNSHLQGKGCMKCSGAEIGNVKFIFNNSLPNFKFNKKSLRFDFYLPNYNMCIEYDGDQHFRLISKFGGQKRFEIGKERDEIKNKYCLDNNIRLLRVAYNESVIDKLDSIFNI